VDQNLCIGLYLPEIRYTATYVLQSTERELYVPVESSPNNDYT